MRLRALAAVLGLLALGLYFGVTARQRQQAAAAADEYRRVREERRELGLRLAQKLRLEDAQRRAGHLAAEGGATPARAARLRVVRSLSGSGVSRVRLGVVPAGRPPLAVSVRLSGEGTFEDVVRLSGDVVRPGNGLLLSRLALQNQDDRVGLSLEAVGLGRP